MAKNDTSLNYTLYTCSYKQADTQHTAKWKLGGAGEGKTKNKNYRSSGWIGEEKWSSKGSPPAFRRAASASARVPLVAVVEALF